MRTFQGWNDSFEATQFKKGIDGFLIVDYIVSYFLQIVQHTVLGTNTRVVQSTGYRVNGTGLTFFILQQVALKTMNDAWLPDRKSTRLNSSHVRISYAVFCLKKKTTYFSAGKVQWILENVDGVREAAEAGDAVFGNTDTWLLWHLTGGVDGGVHVTDVTNASRTMLMNLETLDWDDELISFFNIPRQMLPEIRPSSDPNNFCYTLTDAPVIYTLSLHDALPI